MTDLSDFGLLVVRICLSAVYLFSGIDKLTNCADSIAELQVLKLPNPALLRYAVIAVQLIGGLMVLLGVHAGWGAAPVTEQELLQAVAGAELIPLGSLAGAHQVAQLVGVPGRHEPRAAEGAHEVGDAAHGESCHMAVDIMPYGRFARKGGESGSHGGRIRRRPDR